MKNLVIFYINKPTPKIKKWRVRVNKKTIIKTTRAADLISNFSNFLSRCSQKKMAIVVPKDNNASVETSNKKYLIGITACFLEKYINLNTYRKYFKAKYSCP